MGQLSDVDLRNAKPRAKPWKLWYGELGLYWSIMPTGSKLARAKVYINGRERTLSLGPHPTISVAKAVKLVLDRRADIYEKVDPIAAKRELRERNREERRALFGDVAQRWYRSKVGGWSATHARDIRRILAELKPLDAKPMVATTQRHVDDILDGIIERGSLVYLRDVKLYFRKIWRFYNASAGHEHQLHDPSESIVLPDTPREKHHARLPESEIGKFLCALAITEALPLVRIAFMFMLLTGLRTGELRHLQWSDVEMRKRQLRIPPERMKAHLEHLVPLSDQAIALLQDVQQIAGKREGLVFPSPLDPATPLSDGTFLALIRRAGYATRMTGHGCRSLLSTFGHEAGFNGDAVELALAHTPGNAVSRAYNSALHLVERRRLLAAWADHLDQLQREARKFTLRSVA